MNIASFCSGVLAGWFFILGWVLEGRWKQRREEHKAKKLAARLDCEEMTNQLAVLVNLHKGLDVQGCFILGHETITQGIRADMDILSKRITNALEYVTAVMAAHKLEFHTKKRKK